MSTQLHYYETRVATPAPPLDTATHLVRSGLHDSHVVYERDGYWTYAGGVWAELILTTSGIEGRLPNGHQISQEWATDPLAQVNAFLTNLPIADWRAYGWAAFELSYVLSGIEFDDHHQRLLHLVVPRAEIRMEKDITTVRGAGPDDLQNALSALNAVTPILTTPPTVVDVRTCQGTAYHSAVTSAVEEINAGLLEKVILSRVVELPDDIDLSATYLAGRRGNRPARSFLLKLGGIESTGFSPEIVVKVSADRIVQSQPLAGTRALTGCPGMDAKLRADLLSNPKEIYEHAISVKTGADELTDVCVPGTVEVPEFMAIRERGSVQHLASRVSGLLREDCGPWDAFAAVFPAVTASGVPKRAAYGCIQRHEEQPRGLYSGSVMTISSTGEMDAALVLRSAYRSGGRAWLRAGAGIVGQSTPEREFEETCEKLESVSRYLVPAVTTSADSSGTEKTRVPA